LGLTPVAHNHSHILLFTGRFGSGKTEVAINYALALAKQGNGRKHAKATASVILIRLGYRDALFSGRGR